MSKNYTHLSYEERVEIRVLRKLGKSIREVSRELDRAPSTISRELKRNEQFADTRVIYPIHAQYKANGRRKRAYRKPRLKSIRTQRYVERKLRLGWSPELISGRMQWLNMPDRVSHEAIYQWIYRKRPDLRTCLVRHHKRRKRRGQSKKHRCGHIPSLVGLEKRPAAINDRLEFGHWESDSMVTKRNTTALHVVVERISRRVCINKVNRNTAENIRKSLLNRLASFPRQARKSITYDRGPENAYHLKVNSSLRTKSYFCQPGAAWEKGAVENMIGRIRRFIPKKKDMRPLSLEAVKKLERQLNNTPRKCLQFQTPMEVFKSLSVALQC